MQNCYYQHDRITREDRHSQDERLSKRHIETLSFVQELGLENKQLKARVDELEAQQLQCLEIHAAADESKERITRLQEQYLKRTDEITTMMAEKHSTEMLKQAGEKLDMERRLQEEIDRLTAEVERLNRENHVLRQRLASREQQDETDDLNEKLANATRELDALNDENMHRDDQSNVISGMEQLQNIKDRNEVLAQELKESNQKNRELKFRTSKLERDLQEAMNDRVDQEFVSSLKNRLTKLHNEKVVFTERQREYEELVRRLNGENESFRMALSEADEDRLNLKTEYGKLITEIVSLKRQLNVSQDRQTFQNFVELKRETGLLREENEQLRRTIGGKKTSLPMLRHEKSLPLLMETGKKDKKRAVMVKSATMLN